MTGSQRAVVVAAAAIALLAPVAAGATVSAAAGTAGVISTVAGGVGGPARAARVALSSPCGVSFAAGRLYVASGGSVRQVNPRTGRLATPAGTGVAGPLGDGGRATRASLSSACGVAVDRAGNLVIADGRHDRIRVVAATTGSFYGRVMTGQDIYTVAGDGTAGFSGDGGPATRARLDIPGSVVVDAAGNLLIADTSNGRIRVVAASSGTFYGQRMTAGDIYTVAGGGTGALGDGGPATKAVLRYPAGVAVDAAGNLLIADTSNGRIRAVAASSGTFYGQRMTAGDIYTVAGGGTGALGDGGPATKATLGTAHGVAVDAAGNLLIADTSENRIRAVAASSGTFYGQRMTAGDIYTVAGDGTHGFSGDGGPATAAKLNFPGGVATDTAGNLVIADTWNNRARVVAARTGSFYGKAMTGGDIYTIAGNGRIGFSGDGGPAASAELNLPWGLVTDAAGNLVIADTWNNRIRVTAARTGTFYGKSMTGGHIYAVAGNGTRGFSGDGGPATAAKLRLPSGVATDAAGNLVIADTYNGRIRVVAARTGSFYGQAMTGGHIYTVAGNGTRGFSGDGGPATSAELNLPWDVTTDAAGNLLLADAHNYRIRVVAARTGSFYGQAMTGGHIYTIAGNGTFGFSGDGGPATAAELTAPYGVATDAAGNVVLADADNGRVRVVAARTGSFYGQSMTGGHIYTVAGNGTFGFSGDGGPATSAELAAAEGVATDAAGNLLIADTDNNRIRVVAARTGSFYGQAMTGGHIYTIAGNGTYGFSGDGGPATAAELSTPADVATGTAGNLLITDRYSQRIRVVAG